MGTFDFDEKINALINEEVKRRIDFALVCALEGGHTYEMYKRMEECFGDNVGDILADLYAHAVESGRARPTLEGVRIDPKSLENFEFSSIDLSDALKKLSRRKNIVLQLHDADA